MIDGRGLFGCSLEAWPDHPLNGAGFTVRMLLAGRNLRIPPLSDIDEAGPPLVAWVQQNHAVVSCPSCATNPAEEKAPVWLDGPLLAICCVCGSGGMWRRVVLPDGWDEAVALLGCRPAGARTWQVGQSTSELRAENERYGWGREVD